MIHELYRVLNIVIVLLLSLVLTATQSVLLKAPILHWIELDLLLVMVVYLSLHRSFFEGSLLVLIIGRIVEIHSGAPAGMVLSCYLAVFLAIFFTKEMFLVGTSFSGIVLAMGGGIIFKVMFFVLAQRYGILENVWRTSMEYTIPYLLSLGVFSRPVFELMKRIDISTHFDKDSEAKSLSGEEF